MLRLLMQFSACFALGLVVALGPVLPSRPPSAGAAAQQVSPRMWTRVEVRPAGYDNDRTWWRWLDKFESYYSKKFEATWKTKDKDFWRSFPGV